MTVPHQKSNRNSEASHLPETPQLALTLTVAELMELVELAAARAHAAQPAPPQYVDDRAAAAAFDTSPQSLAKHAALGAPHIIVGDRRRWNIAQLADWFRARASAEAAE